MRIGHATARGTHRNARCAAGRSPATSRRNHPGRDQHARTADGVGDGQLLYGRTNSPWDLERTPGGSSGGEAAAIAAGMSAGGVGSDGGGSIRVPAHFSGICGLKPTPGRIPATGHFPASGGPFALIGVVGPMARTVADLKALFEVMQGPDDGDTCAAPVPLRWPSDGEVRKLRVGYFEDDGRTPVTPETRIAVRTAAEALRGAGFRSPAVPPRRFGRSTRIVEEILVTAGGMLIRPMFLGREHELSPVLQPVPRVVRCRAAAYWRCAA